MKQIENVRDWYPDHPDHPDVFVASAIADVSNTTLAAAQDLAEGRWKPGKIIRIGLERPEAVSLALAPDVPAKVVEEVEALRAKIVSGEIEVSVEYKCEEFQP